MEKAQGDPRDVGKGSRTTPPVKVWVEEALKDLSPSLGGLEDSPEGAAPSSRCCRSRTEPAETPPNADHHLLTLRAGGGGEGEEEV